MKWKTKFINLGEVKVGVKRIIEFVTEEPLVNVSSVKSTCGCSKPVRNGDKITVSFTPGAIPVHLQSLGKYTTTKKVIITYNDGSQDFLKFQATIIR